LPKSYNVQCRNDHFMIDNQINGSG
jgi:hypothetical protein